jgi:hypothetical protein
MQRDLERRLQALETSWFGSPKIAAYFRMRAMSDEELIYALANAMSSLSDAELDRVLNDDDERSGPLEGTE